MAPFFVLEDFISYLKIEKRYSEHTAIAYEKDILQFFEFGDFKSSKDLREVNAMLIRSWMVALIEGATQNRSVNRKLSALRSFFKWLKKENHIDFNPMAKVSGPKMNKRLPQFAKESELKKDKIDGFFTDDFDGLRDRLIFEMLYQTGIRLNELIELKDNDVNESSIKVLGKRNKERILPLLPNIINQIKLYLTERAYLERITDNDIFFLTLKGVKMNDSLVYRLINNYFSTVSEKVKKSPHILRHTFATHLLNNGADLNSVKELLGHSSLASTQIYTQSSLFELKKVYGNSHPRNKK